MKASQQITQQSSGRQLTTMLHGLLLVGTLLGWTLRTTVAKAGDVHFHFHEEDDDDDDWEETKSKLTLLGLAAAGIGATVAVTSPFWGPRSVIEDEDVAGYFQKYPYEEGGGFMRLENDPSYEPWPYSFRWTTEYGYDFDNLERIGTNLHLETTSRVGFDAEANWFSDHDRRGVAMEDFWVADVNATFRFGQSHHAQWWAGLGLNWLDADSSDPNYGFNATYGADIFLGDPWILSGALDYGLDDDFFHGRLTLGANWKSVEAFVGYDFLNVGPREHDTIMLGLRTWW